MRINLIVTIMDSEVKYKWLPGFLDILTATCYFIALAALLILWKPGSWGWGLAIHALINACLVLTLLSLRGAGHAFRKPLSLPDILLFLVFLYAIINTFLSQVRYPALEWLPFYLDGLFLFYIGTTLFARRFEGILLLFFLCLAILVSLTVMGGYTDIWVVRGDASSLYRGGKMLTRVVFDHPLWGCGSGVLPLLKTRYLPLGDRHPPIFDGGYEKLLAEEGFIGVALKLLFLGGLAFALSREKGGVSSLRKTQMVCFRITVFGLIGILAAGIFTTLFMTPAGFFLFLPLAGMALMLRQEAPASSSLSKKQAFRISTGFLLAVLVPILVVTILESTPALAIRLAHYGQAQELGTRGLDFRLRIARFLAPYHPDIHLTHAKHLRSRISEKNKGLIWTVEFSYLRAIRQNRYNENAYLEYAHFLDLAEDYGSLVSNLEKGRRFCPGSAELNILLFRAYMKMGRRKEALDALDWLKRFYPLDYATHERLGNYYREAGSPGSSQEASLLAVQVQPLFTGEK